MDTGWTLSIADKPDRTVAKGTRDLDQGEIEVRIDLYALTANTATYSRLSDCPIPYRTYFTSPEAAEVPPTWGIGTVTRSEHPDVAVGQRIFGYVPMATHHTMKVEDKNDRLVDVDAAHADMHEWYRTYRKLGSRHPDEARWLNIWPVFPASFNLARTVVDHPANLDCALITSASSKTALGVASMLRTWSEIRTVGLTSSANLKHAQSTGVFDEVFTYEDQAGVEPGSRTALLDLTGNADLLTEVTRSHADNLSCTYLLGYTHPNARVHLPPLSGPEPAVFFTPAREDELIKRRGREAHMREYLEAEARFVELSKTWFVSPTTRGREAAVEQYEDLMTNRPVPWVSPTVAPQHAGQSAQTDS